MNHSSDPKNPGISTVVVWRSQKCAEKELSTGSKGCPMILRVEIHYFDVNTFQLSKFCWWSIKNCWTISMTIIFFRMFFLMGRGLARAGGVGSGYLCDATIWEPLKWCLVVPSPFTTGYV